MYAHASHGYDKKDTDFILGGGSAQDHIRWLVSGLIRLAGAGLL